VCSLGSVKGRIYTPFPSYILCLQGNWFYSNFPEFWRILDIKDPQKDPQIFEFRNCTKGVLEGHFKD